jgi:oligopeptide/dipeptide ABC transporter ATP-binding protein
LSGGEKQRVGVMRALACEPSVIFLDEPTSALDVSVQAQVLRTLREIQERTGVSFILISHDVAVVRYMCSRLLVMYLGEIVEEGPTEALFVRPRHPYTRALFDAVPRLHPKTVTPVLLEGELTTRNVRVSSCLLLPRCPFAMEACASKPPMITVEKGHGVACWLMNWKPLS